MLGSVCHHRGHRLALLGGSVHSLDGSTSRGDLVGSEDDCIATFSAVAGTSWSRRDWLIDMDRLVLDFRFVPGDSRSPRVFMHCYDSRYSLCHSGGLVNMNSRVCGDRSP